MLAARATQTCSLSLTGYSFTGWNTVANGTGTPYATGTSFGPSANLSLYAQWSLTPTYSVTYDANGATGGSAPMSASGVVSTVTLDNNSGLLAKSEYTFQGWNTNAAGTGTSYQAGQTITLTANLTLFAQWTSNGPPHPKFIVGDISKRRLDPTGGTVTISGEKLDKVDYISIDGERLSILSSSYSSIVVVITAHKVGFADMIFTGDGAILTYINAIEFVSTNTQTVVSQISKSGSLTSKAFEAVILAMRNNREYANVVISFGQATAKASSTLSISLKDNQALLKLAMKLANLMPHSISVNIKVTGNVNRIELSFSNS